MQRKPPSAYQLALGLQRLADLVDEGIPLEPALRRVARQGGPTPIHQLFSALATDLEKGCSPESTLLRQGLNGVFASVFLAGCRSQNLPAALSSLAQHYERMATTAIRLRVLLFYPTLLLLLCILSGSLLSHQFLKIHREFEMLRRLPPSDITTLNLPTELGWMCLAWFPLILVLFLAIALMRSLHQITPSAHPWLRIPGLHEVGLSRVSSLFHLLLSGGIPLPDAIQHVRKHESHPQLRKELAEWHAHLQEGHRTLPDSDHPDAMLPSMMTWLAQGSRGGWADGFSRAAAFYHASASQKLDRWIHTLVPACIIALGICVLCQMVSLFALFASSHSILTWT